LDRFALDVDAAVALEKTPVRIEAPQVATIVADGKLALLRCSRILDFRDARAVNTARRAIGTISNELRVVVAVGRPP
jgi:hypothetical protein